MVGPTLLERDTELGLLSGIVTAVGTSGGRVVLVRGEAGIGRSALVHGFLRSQSEAAHVHVGTCDDLIIAQPLGPFWDMARAERSLRAPLEEGNRPRLLQAILDLLSRRSPTIMLIEDTHWADEATLDAIRYVGRRIEQANGVLVLTYRDGEVDYDHPLRAVIGDIPAPSTRTSGGPSTVRNNRTSGILVYGPALVEGNEVVAPEQSLWWDKQYGSAIDVQGGEGWIIRNNTVTGFREDVAINASRGRDGEIVDNIVVDSQIGISLGAGSHVVDGNQISGGDAGIVQGAGSSRLTGNNVTGVSGRGLALGGSPVLRDDYSCDNGENLSIGEGATPDIDESNEICPDTQSG